METKILKTKVGRPQKDNAKIGLSISKEAKEMMDALSEATGRTKSNIVEEALSLMKQHEATITARAKQLSSLSDDDYLDLDEYMKNRREKRKAELYNVSDISVAS